MNSIPNLPAKEGKRLVIVGAGFAGLKLAQSLTQKYFQVILIDKNNYHQFQPLFYQVATSGLEPSSIAFPIRRVFNKSKHVHFRVAQVENIDWKKHVLETDQGSINYDYLVLSAGATTNFFGNKNLEEHAIPMKSLSEALFLRNRILDNYEKALNTGNSEEQEALMNIVIAGGGPTGVELAGAIAEMRAFVLPKDYPSLDFSKMQITLLEGSPRLLNGMLDFAGENALNYLNKLKVNVALNTLVEDFDGHTVHIKDSKNVISKTLIWAAGIKANFIAGFEQENTGKGGRIMVNSFSQTLFAENVFVLGDQAIMETVENPNGDPQVAQVAIQQAENLTKNLSRLQESKELKPFVYNDRGSMATIGRNLAVCDLPFAKLKGYPAWALWLFVHLMAILGTKNKLFVFMNWVWNYVTYNQSLRLLIKPKFKN